MLSIVSGQNKAWIPEVSDGIVKWPLACHRPGAPGVRRLPGHKEIDAVQNEITQRELKRADFGIWWQRRVEI